MLLTSTGTLPLGSLVLKTRSHTDIDNIQAWELTHFEWNQEKTTPPSFKNIKRLTEPCPIYNCHGLTFGSRRTAVTHHLEPVLRDDGYKLVDLAETKVQEGDIIIYVDDAGEIQHSGFVVAIKADGILSSSLALQPIIFIWSKWGKGSEWIHPVEQIDFYKGDEYIQYYRLADWSDAWKNL